MNGDIRNENHHLFSPSEMYLSEMAERNGLLLACAASASRIRPRPSLLILVRLRGGKRMERRHSNMNLTSPTVLDQAYLNLRRGFDRVPLIEAKLAPICLPLPKP
jgi:hypothetical protein